MTAHVVDTNVPIVANGRNNLVDPRCVIACIDALAQVREGIIVLDNMMMILDEYRRQLNMSGQPGAGDLFMKWVWSVQADQNKCEQVPLRMGGVAEQDYLDFPNDDADLAAFDRSDRKFFVVAKMSTRNPIILNAVDSDWANFYHAVHRHGVRVQFLCPQHVCP